VIEYNAYHTRYMRLEQDTEAEYGENARIPFSHILFLGLTIRKVRSRATAIGERVCAQAHEGYDMLVLVGHMRTISTVGNDRYAGLHMLPIGWPDSS